MTTTGRREYLRAIYDRYRRSNSEKKGMILDQFCRVCGYDRKYAIRLLRGPRPPVRPLPRRPRGPAYGREVIQILAMIWEAAGFPWSGRDRTLIVVRPETVIAWHRRGFRLFWRRKSGPAASRPRIPRSHIRYIQRISGDHPEWGEDRIAEEPVVKFGVTQSSSTIRRYMVPRERPPCATQTWRTCSVQLLVSPSWVSK